MRIVLQRVSSAGVTTGGETIARIGPGLLLLVGITAADTAADGEWLAAKISKLRIFSDESGQMNRSILDLGGEFLVVSQFTLHASTAKGTRPSFNAAATPEHAEPLYQLFINELKNLTQLPVATGRFGALMEVAITNSGPVTLILDSKSRV